MATGTAKVCHKIIVEDKFQPGFTYNFPDSVFPDTFNATVNEIPVVHYGFDYNLTITQLAPGQTNLVTNTGIARLSCTKGILCNDEPYNSGTIISADNIMSTNPTIEQLDAIKAKDPELFEKLLSNYYYKLKRETESGGKTEEIFYKQ